jgi:hypothetical protein
MAGKQINFTKKTIEALASPTKSVRAYDRDTKEAGFSVSVTRVGTPDGHNIPQPLHF